MKVTSYIPVTGQRFKKGNLSKFYSLIQSGNVGHCDTSVDDVEGGRTYANHALIHVVKTLPVTGLSKYPVLEYSDGMRGIECSDMYIKETGAGNYSQVLELTEGSIKDLPTRRLAVTLQH